VRKGKRDGIGSVGGTITGNSLDMEEEKRSLGDRKAEGDSFSLKLRGEAPFPFLNSGMVSLPS